MKLIERSSPQSLQTFLISSPKESNAELVKANLLQRLLRHLITSQISEQDFKENLSDRVCLKVIKVSRSTNPDQNREVLIGNLNYPTFLEDESPIPETVIQGVKSIGGAEFPREKYLSERLKELNYSSEDPIRMSSSTVEFLYESSLTDMTYSTIKEESELFYDFLYSSTECSLKDKIKATYIISIDKILTSKKAEEKYFTKEVLSKMVDDIDDLTTREEIFISLNKYLSEPQNRPKMVEDARRCLKKQTSNSSKSPIKTWKVVASCVILILGVLAYTNRDRLKYAYKISSESKDLEKSKFSLFTRSLFSKEGYSQAKNYVNSFSTERDYENEKDGLKAREEWLSAGIRRVKRERDSARNYFKRK